MKLSMEERMEWLAEFPLIYEGEAPKPEPVREPEPDPISQMSPEEVRALWDRLLGSGLKG